MIIYKTALYLVVEKESIENKWAEKKNNKTM